MEIRTMQIIITKENSKLLSDVWLRCHKDLRYVTYLNCPSEAALRNVYGFGKSCLGARKANERKVKEMKNTRLNLINRLRQLQKNVTGIEILPVGPFQAYELKGKYGNPDRPDQEGFVILITNSERVDTVEKEV